MHADYALEPPFIIANEPSKAMTVGVWRRNWWSFAARARDRSIKLGKINASSGASGCDSLPMPEAEHLPCARSMLRVVYNPVAPMHNYGRML